jgi:neurotransmitter:Na+ symporter, NSS family
MEQSRGQWSSKIGFIFAAAGSAIGLGNIWRFPYVAGQNGGAAFVLLYLFFIVIIGLPYMMAEFAIGRHTKKNPIGAIESIKPGSLWKAVGVLGVVTGLVILSFYGVIAGWTFGYIFNMAFGNSMVFEEFIANPLVVVILFAFFMLITTLIVHGGIESGIEKWSKILMPSLLVLLLGMVIYANTLEGSSEGLSFYLNPDFSKITGSVIISALGQAFFSLSLGMGLMITYGSYLSKSEDIVGSTLYIGLFDTMIAIMSGLIIFPALFSLGGDVSQGPELIFMVFPKLFANIPGGFAIGSIFFLLLSIAALTSTISLLEVPVSYMVDEKKKDRKKIVWGAAFLAFLIGLPSALSQGSVEIFTEFGVVPTKFSDPDFLSHMSFLFGDISLTVGALFLSIFIGWIWGAKNAAAEIAEGSKIFKSIMGIWIFMIKYFIPIVIFLFLLNTLGIYNLVF